jgi:hypothetical protein
MYDVEQISTIPMVVVLYSKWGGESSVLIVFSMGIFEYDRSNVF